MADVPSDAEVAATTTAMVTGAGGHIGAALLRLLTAAGDRTIGVDRPGVDRPGVGRPGVDRTGVDRLGAVSGTDAAERAPRWIEADLADPAAEEELTAALADVPRLDLVVAAAGVTALGDLDTTADATFRQVMDVNYHGALRTTRAALPALRRAGGHLVVISSVAGLVPVPGRPAYVGAKHALTGTFLALADELARDGVAVTVVHPAFLRSAVTAVGAAAPRSTTGSALDADDVARAIIRLVVRRRRGRRVPSRVLIGRTAHLADGVARLAPGLARGLAARRLRD